MRSPYTLLVALYALLALLATQGCGQLFKGSQGDPGAPGKDSGPCTVVRAGTTSTVSCPDGTEVEIPDGVDGSPGTEGPKGDQGNTGQTGLDGAPGLAGNNGTDATPVTTIQFCPGYTTTYPSTFPEFGLCLSGNVFAVYWDGHNSWLTKVVPGYYASTSTSAPCSFTLSTTCRVTQ